MTRRKAIGAVATGAAVFGQVRPALAQQTSADTTSQEADVLAFERNMEAAVVRGDVAFLDQICASDFSFTHGDGWVTGGKPLRVENKSQWLTAVGKKPYLSRDLASVQAELHGDIAITYGMYHARNRTAGTRPPNECAACGC